MAEKPGADENGRRSDRAETMKSGTAGDGKKFKIMRGAASFSVQQEFAGEDPEYIEGAESIVAYK